MQLPQGVPRDRGEAGRTRNLLTRISNTKEIEPETAELDELITDSDGVFDLVTPSDYQAGDLVELSDNSGKDAGLAICLGYINGFYHLYTQDGRWIVAVSFRSRFVVPNFVNKAMLEPVVAKIPTEPLPLETLRKMSTSEYAPDRAAGGQLLSKMVKFLQASEEVAQRFGITLDRAHTNLTEATTQRYLTLKEIHSVLFKEGQKVPANPIVLYAIHRALISNDLCFRIIGTKGDPKTQLYEVTPTSDVALVHNIQTLVRAFTDIPGKTGKPLSSLTPEDWTTSPIGTFILKARKAIDQSRIFRDFTPYGMVGPAKKHRPPYNPAWNRTDLSIMHFMRLWVCYDQFSPSSTCHWIGSAILRATGKYKDSEYLSATVGWTFLQEIGYISPWDLHTRHLQRVPDVGVSRVRGFEPLQLGPTGIEEHISRDDLIPARKRYDWKDMRAFAIDSEDTVDVDDAVSIEPTDVPGVLWVHIHVADPASRVRPDSDLAKRAEKTPLTLYLSGHRTNMWGIKNELEKLFSLAPNKPCLTFSGKINLQGELLDHKITPGILRHFVYMTPEEADKAIGEHDTNGSDTSTFSVGKPPEKQPVGRPMTAASDLKPEDLKALKLLHQLGKALHEKRLAKGAMPSFPPEPAVKASFSDDTIRAQSIPGKQVMEGSLHCNGDPFIEIGWPSSEGSLLVASAMRLAGEIAARWSGDRNIPLPYITQPEAQKNLAVLQSYTQNVYYPRLLRGEEISTEQSLAFFRLLGTDQLSIRPGPYFLMGIDAYAKVTSPLRRYSDLLAHWQIENALLQEWETGSVDVAKLPFQAETLEEEVFPWMCLRQRIIRGLDRQKGVRGYMLQALVRAWKYADKHSSPVPETFRFTVRNLASIGSRNIHGNLDWFKMPAILSVESLPKLGVQAIDIAKGDVFEVRLTDVNAHLETVHVEAVSKVKVASEQVREQPEDTSESTSASPVTVE